MSASLVWEPADRKRKSLPDGLKYVLHKRGNSFPLEVDSGDVNYFSALRDAGITGAQDVLDAIEKHDRIVLDLEY